MSRIPYLTLADMTPRQREVNEIFLANRPGETHVSGPVAFWMRNPELGLAHDALRLHMERATSLPRALSEIAITAANRHWSAEFPWCRHQAAALRAGQEAAPLEALRLGQQPRFADPTAQAVFEFCDELLRTTGVGDATYRRTLDRIGEEAVIELTALVAYGTLLSISSNTFGPEEPEPIDCTLPPIGPPPTLPERAEQTARLDGVAASGDVGDILGRVAGLAEPWLAYEAVLRDESSVRSDIRHLTALLVARFWRCPGLWVAHVPLARRDGIDDAVLVAIGAGDTPDLTDPDQAVGWNFAAALLTEGVASDAVQEEAIARLGVTTVIELVAVCGFQTLAAMTLNVFEASPTAAAFSP